MKSWRYRWYYPRCFRVGLPRGYSLYLWVFSLLWPGQWRCGFRRNPHRTLQTVLNLGPIEVSLGYPHDSRLAR